eukprot:g2652.t1
MVEILAALGQVADKIRQAKEKRGMAAGYSTYVAFVVLVSSLVRCFFWYGVRFELPLLFQSIVLIVSQMVLMEAWCDSDRRWKPAVHIRDGAAQGLPGFVRAWWTWNTFDSYVIAMGSLAAGLVALTFLLADSAAYFEVLGFAALGIEANLGTPQMLKNFRQGSTAGMSRFMVYNWLLGDTVKTVLFLVRGNPLQFVVCGFLQLGVDFVILAQIALLPSTSKDDGEDKEQ